MILMNEKKGVIASQFGSSFTYSLVNTDLALDQGNYYLMISPHWNAQAGSDKAYS